MRAACGLARVEQLSHRGGSAFLACAVVWAGPWSFSRWWVWMMRSALPVVVGVGSDEEVADTEPSARLGGAAGTEVGGIVGHRRFDVDNVRVGSAQGAEQEGSGGVPAFVARYFDLDRCASSTAKPATWRPALRLR